MKHLALALVVTALAAGSALAQTQGAPAPVASSRCGEMPEAPSIPDGATANRRTMNAAHEAYNAWGAQAQTVLACRRAEVAELNARTEVLVNEFNTASAQAHAVSEQMAAEAAEFSAR